MNDNLDAGSIEDLIGYRLLRAFETLEEADYTAKGGYLMPQLTACITHAIMLRLH